jgi:decaprenylphospho-beta-D-erythro-pentofuranosid-2-ulose 2-reductase
MKDALGSAQSVLLLGGTSEIGLASIRALPLRDGAVVVLAGRDRPALEAAAATLSGVAGRVEVVRWDAAGGPPAAEAALKNAASAAGGDIDIVIAAAGVLGEQERASADLVYAATVLEVNLVGVGSAVLAAGQLLAKQGHGTLVVLSSVAGIRARKGNFVYGASKAGLDALSAGLGDALASSGVKVVVVRPGFVSTKMTAGMKPAPFATTPDAVGLVVAEAVRKGTPEVYAPSVLRYVFGIFRVLPRPVWRILSSKG